MYGQDMLGQGIRLIWNALLKRDEADGKKDRY